MVTGAARSRDVQAGTPGRRTPWKELSKAYAGATPAVGDNVELDAREDVECEKVNDTRLCFR